MVVRHLMSWESRKPHSLFMLMVSIRMAISLGQVMNHPITGYASYVISSHVNATLDSCRVWDVNSQGTRPAAGKWLVHSWVNRGYSTGCGWSTWHGKGVTVDSVGLRHNCSGSMTSNQYQPNSSIIIKDHHEQA